MSKFSLLFTIALTVILSVCSLVMAQTPAFDITRIDNSADACTDFFQYANGNWVKNTQIPAAYSRWGTFNILSDNNNNALKAILDADMKSKAATGSDQQLIGDFYASCMDEAAIEKAGATPLDPYFKDIDKIKNTKDCTVSSGNTAFPARLLFFRAGQIFAVKIKIFVNKGF